MALNSAYKKLNFDVEVKLDLYDYIVWTIMWIIETFVHVMIGTAFIAVGLWRVLAYHSTDNHHLGLESSILYWHFVDIVWLFLFISIYYWGS
jgi:heme/copper-type cytochrome/quinol oxidase subunit 3